jgi:hypothetical protein
MIQAVMIQAVLVSGVESALQREPDGDGIHGNEFT